MLQMASTQNNRRTGTNSRARAPTGARIHADAAGATGVAGVTAPRTHMGASRPKPHGRKMDVSTMMAKRSDMANLLAMMPYAMSFWLEGSSATTYTTPGRMEAIISNDDSPLYTIVNDALNVVANKDCHVYTHMTNMFRAALLIHMAVVQAGRTDQLGKTPEQLASDKVLANWTRDIDRIGHMTELLQAEVDKLDETSGLRTFIALTGFNQEVRCVFSPTVYKMVYIQLVTAFNSMTPAAKQLINFQCNSVPLYKQSNAYRMACLLHVYKTIDPHFLDAWYATIPADVRRTVSLAHVIAGLTFAFMSAFAGEMCRMDMIHGIVYGDVEMRILAKMIIAKGEELCIMRTLYRYNAADHAAETAPKFAGYFKANVFGFGDNVFLQVPATTFGTINDQRTTFGSAAMFEIRSGSNPNPVVYNIETTDDGTTEINQLAMIVPSLEYAQIDPAPAAAAPAAASAASAAKPLPELVKVRVAMKKAGSPAPLPAPKPIRKNKRDAKNTPPTETKRRTPQPIRPLPVFPRSYAAAAAASEVTPAPDAADAAADDTRPTLTMEEERIAARKTWAVLQEVREFVKDATAMPVPESGGVCLMCDNTTTKATVYIGIHVLCRSYYPGPEFDELNHRFNILEVQLAEVA